MNCIASKLLESKMAAVSMETPKGQYIGHCNRWLIIK